MSRLLMASRLSRINGNNRLNNIVYIKRQLAKKPSAPLCKPLEKPKPKFGYFPSGGTHARMCDLPLPQGDFMKAWHAKNSRYNMVLLSGIAAVVGAISLAYGSGKFIINTSVPDYPYTDNEMEEFAQEEERRQQEKEEREKRHQSLVDAKELKIRRRKAKEAMPREVELMQADLAGGISDAEMDELVKLTKEREEFETWEKEELQRIENKDKERDNSQKAKKK